MGQPLSVAAAHCIWQPGQLGTRRGSRGPAIVPTAELQMLSLPSELGNDVHQSMSTIHVHGKQVLLLDRVQDCNG